MKNAEPKPFVLHVDDEPDDLRTWKNTVNAAGRIEIDVFHPNDVTEDALRRASVVLVDFKIERWRERDEALSLGLKPSNGLALLSVLQEAAYDLDKASPRAFALFTAVVREVARGLVPQPHTIARAHNLEWIFDKTATDTETRAVHVAELAEAVRCLPSPWPGESAGKAASALQRWLAIPDAPWRESAWQAVMRCRPPLHEFAEHTHGIGVLRWMLHRILPYPTFLLDDAHLASRLRVDLGSLRSDLQRNERLRLLFDGARFVGPLATFAGSRWWRSGVESTIFGLAAEDPANIVLLHERLLQVAPALTVIKSGAAFAVMDENFHTKDRLATPEQVVEILPDDWPPYADSAWILSTDAKAHSDLMAIVVEGDAAQG